MPAIVPELYLGTVRIPQRSVVDLRVRFTPLEGSSQLRMSDGSLRKVTIWQNKLKVSLDGSGKIPAGLGAGVLDYTSSFTFKSPVPRAIPGATNVITVPAARRTDLSVQVIGVAIMDGFEVRETPVSMGGNVATLTVVSGAVAYQALYFPQFSVLAQPPEESIDRRTSDYRWTMELSEV